MSTFGDPRRGISGSGFDRVVERLDETTVSKLQQQYWEAKQIYLKNIKRKEDDCIVASDSELDAKLELFRSIEETCSMLLWTLERFQDRIWVLAHEESATGRFLREAGKIDKTRAGTMLTAAGKTMSFIANQRILLRNPLVRLYQDIETFQYRAVTDTYETIDKMEKARTGYRAALLWMKDISSKLDPDTYKQLEKFRKVQSHVRRCKVRFEKIKMDTYQKIDMLSASRVNMFSHSLGLYQKEWLLFYQKSSKVMSEVDEAFAGYQYYDFNILKQLAEPQRKAIHAGGLVDSDLEKKLNAILEGETSEQKNGESSTSAGEDKLLFYESDKPRGPAKNIPSRKTEEFDLLGLDQSTSGLDAVKNIQENKTKKGARKGEGTGKEHSGEAIKSSTLHDLLTAAAPDERELLNEIFAGPVIEATSGQGRESSSIVDELLKSGPSHSSADCLPSKLLSETFSYAKSSNPIDLISDESQIDLFQQLQSMKLAHKEQESPRRPREPNSTEKWLNLFAELDPLANPDAIGQQPGESDQDRSC